MDTRMLNAIGEAAERVLRRLLAVDATTDDDAARSPRSREGIIVVEVKVPGTSRPNSPESDTRSALMRLSMSRDTAERARALILGTNSPRGEADLHDTATTLAETIAGEAAASLARDSRVDQCAGLPHVLSTRAPLELPAIAVRSTVGGVLLEVVPAEGASL